MDNKPQSEKNRSIDQKQMRSASQYIQSGWLLSCQSRAEVGCVTSVSAHRCVVIGRAVDKIFMQNENTECAMWLMLTNIGLVCVMNSNPKIQNRLHDLNDNSGKFFCRFLSILILVLGCFYRFVFSFGFRFQNSLILVFVFVILKTLFVLPFLNIIC